jgi:hypothetical protein
VLVSAVVESNDMKVFLVADVDATYGMLVLEMYGWDAALLGSEKVSAGVTAGASSLVYTAPVDSFLSALGCVTPAECILLYRYVDSSGEVLSRNFFFLGNLSDATTMADPQLSATVSLDLQVLVTCAPDTLAVFVWLETPLPGTWSDNAFVVIGGAAPAVATFSPMAGATVTPQELQNTLVVSSYFDRARGK